MIEKDKLTVCPHCGGDACYVQEVTADRWDTKEVFSASFVKNALTDAVSALYFLHSRGISHGDFYAHK